MRAFARTARPIGGVKIGTPEVLRELVREESPIRVLLAAALMDDQGRVLNRTLGIAHLGGATLDNEENYLIKKLFTGGLGIVSVENQARI